MRQSADRADLWRETTRKASRGDSEAYKAIFLWLYLWAKDRAGRGSQEERHDLATEFTLRLAEGDPPFHRLLGIKGERLEPYLAATLSHMKAQRGRDAELRQQREALFDEIGESEFGIEVVDPSPHADVERAVLASLDLQAVISNLEGLSLQSRRVVELRVFGGAGFAEIGEALGLTPSAACQRWNAAKKKLRAAMTRL